MTGGSYPTNFFGRLKAEKVGSLPPNLVFFSVSLFSFSSRLFPGFPETYAHPKLKKMPKTKLKCVIPTFFSCFAKILAARTAGATHDSLWARNRVQKWGRSSPTRCFARGQIDRRAIRNRLSAWLLFDRQGDREGDGFGDLCLSCTRHLPSLQIAVEAP